MYEEAREKMPMAAVDDPGESFVTAGQEKKVKMLIPKTTSVYDQFQTPGVPGAELGASDQGSSSDNDPAKDINNQLQGDQVDKGPLAGEDDRVVQEHSEQYKRH